VKNNRDRSITMATYRSWQQLPKLTFREQSPAGARGWLFRDCPAATCGAIRSC